MHEDMKNLLINSDLMLYYHGNEKCKPGHSWGPAVKEHYKIHYIHSGSGIFTFNKRTYPLGAGQCFLIYPNRISHYQADMDNPWTYSWVAFDGAYTEEYLKRAGFSQSNPILHCKLQNEIESCLSDMNRTDPAANGSDLRLKSMLYLFFSLMIEGAGSNPENGKMLKYTDEYIRKAIEFVQINYSTRINVTDIARNISLDRKYLSALFKKAAGVPLQKYLVTYRIEKACSLMMQDCYSIGDVARSVGYDDPFVFSRMFRKLKGISPRQFANQLNGNTEED